MLSHSALAPVHLGLHRLHKRVLMAVGILGDWATFIGAVLILGLGTSWYMIDVGTRLTTEKHGPWVGWTSAGRADADPYTRAHFARLGTLQLTTEIALTFVALTDSDGNRLHSSCDYAVEGREPGNHWWSLTVFNDRGDLIANAAQRYTYTSEFDRPASRRHLRRDTGARGQPRQLAADRRRRPPRPDVHDLRCGNDYARQVGGRAPSSCR